MHVHLRLDEVLVGGNPLKGLAQAAAALQRPSWGHWNGMIAALRDARRTVLRSGSPEERERLGGAEALLHDRGAHRLLDAFLIDDRQHPWHGRIDERHMGILSAATFCRCTREQF